MQKKIEFNLISPKQNSTFANISRSIQSFIMRISVDLKFIIHLWHVQMINYMFGYFRTLPDWLNVNNA